MNELSNFCRQGTSYAADWGHDDLVMAAVQTEFVKESLQYTIMKQTFDSQQHTLQESTLYNPYDNPGIPPEIQAIMNGQTPETIYNPYQDMYRSMQEMERQANITRLRG